MRPDALRGEPLLRQDLATLDPSLGPFFADESAQRVLDRDPEASVGALDAVDTPELGPGEDREAAATLLRKINTISRLIGDKTPKLPPGNGARKPVGGSPLR